MSETGTEREFDSLNGNSPSSEKEMVFSEGRASKKKRIRKGRMVLLTGVVIGVCGIISLIIGVVFVERAKVMSNVSKVQNGCDEPDTKQTSKPRDQDACAYSGELLKSGLLQLFDNITEEYYNHHPYEIVYKIKVSRQEILDKFRPFNPTPKNIKATTDKSRLLLDKLNSIRINERLLKPREAKTLAKTRHFLEHNFGSPYDNSYYTGEWMLGPSRFCYMQTINKFIWNIGGFLFKLNSTTLEDMEYLISMLRLYGQGISKYRENIEMGVKTGMVSSIEECSVGFDCLADKFPAISMTLSAQDVLKERFAGQILGDKALSKAKNASFYWTKKYQTTLARSLRDAVVDHLGTPLAGLFKYLSQDHRSHCVPSNVSSGLATRPVKFVYNNGKPKLSQPTTQSLPTGERLDGKKAYERILKFFTTTSLTPDAVHEIGWVALRSLYPQVVEIARRVTGIWNETEAMSEFRMFLNSSDMYYNDKPFPANESDERAYRICRNPIAAQFYCPVRYATLQKWHKSALSTLGMLEPKLLGLFHWLVGPKKTTPICPVAMSTTFVASNGAQSYSRSTASCRYAARYRVPFFLDRMGPKYSEWTVNAHEAMPGHHMQSQGYLENFRDVCSQPLLSVLIRSHYADSAYSEGWGLYAENPLTANDTATYKRNYLQRYGMLKWQIWRALRLIVDTGIHYKGMNREQALKLFDQYALDDSDVVEKEVTRYQSGPGQATAYMIGQRAIIDMRKKTQAKLGKKFALQDFHYFFLSIGPAPLSFVEEHIDRLADCELDSEGPGCEGRLEDHSASRPRASKTRSLDEIMEEDFTAPHIHEM